MLVIVAAVMGFQMMGQNNSQVEMVNENQVDPNAMIEETQIEYADGTYEMIGEYVSPGGPETVGVTITLTDGVITDANVEVLATRPASVDKQTDFAANYKPMVIGKNIDEVVLTKVSGSSLTPKGFNDAIEKIKLEAQS